MFPSSDGAIILPPCGAELPVERLWVVEVEGRSAATCSVAARRSVVPQPVSRTEQRCFEKMEDLARAVALASDIECALEQCNLEQCERLKRCITEIVPLLKNLQAMKKPFGHTTVRAIAQLQEALEPMLRVVTEERESHELCEQMIVLRQLWQRQIELHLAVQFQKVLEEDVDKSARRVWETKTVVGVGGGGSVTPRL
ncbi:LOW QUALITY PROTEIN: hypothetical protein BSKO_06003 [Bryopsis sp. KO-2023]|nr:LOW QUALITY PROTEIN: hypothetical protein BSKO_06003 [Bryopsis sp. KO-2023]